MEFIRHLGPDVHVIAVCQPAPLVLAAVSVLSELDPDAAPTSMTLMGGPVDTRANPTVPTELAMERSLDWFETRCITTVPAFYPAAHRRVYPGFLQLGAFIAMNFDRHVDAHMNMFRHLVVGDGESADGHRRFYDEYLSVMDVPAEYYLQTVQGIFQEHWLPKGTFEWRGHLVRPSMITRTALMTVEGELDDISAPGQTLAAHGLCPNIPDKRRAQYLQPGVGHYGIFNGRRWREQIMPRIASFITDSAVKAE
jgi:poly(3-hydroxybutyrate) depolymerase